MPWSTRTSWGWGRRPERRPSLPDPSGPTLLRIDGPIRYGGVASWWGKGWCEALERTAAPERLSQGRWHARQGRVAWLEVRADGVVARVEGGNALPRTVTIRLRQWAPSQWERALEALAMRASYGAALLNDELPQAVETDGISVLPTGRDDVLMACGCSEGRGDVCKHILAAWYVLGERVDADPFLLFLLRGRAKADVLADLRARRARAPGPNAPATMLTEEPGQPADRVAFWTIPADASLNELPTVVVDGTVPAVAVSPLRRLGPPPFWHGPADFDELMAKTYGAISRHAAALQDEPADTASGPSE